MEDDFTSLMRQNIANFRLDREVLDRASGMPMSHYTQAVKFMTGVPHLKNADVVAVRDHVLEKGPFVDVPDLPKCSKKAASVRQVGNRLFLARRYKEALEKYNESICWAEEESEDLGIGYANRSAIYYDQGEFKLSLVNIALAKKHHYPQKLMPKLLARELNCKRRINMGQTKVTIPCPRLAMNLETNPKIPFLAAGIAMKHIAEYGRSMVAERDFKAGEVLLQENPIVSSISPELKYKNCSFCSVENFHSLIPCPKCVSAMYCSQECLDRAFKVGHRFECGITEKLQHASYGNSRIYLGPRMFFYAMSLFNDNLEEMMEYCEANGRTGGNPFELDYTNYDPLEEFKVFHTAKLPDTKFYYKDYFSFYAAIFCSIFDDNASVKDVFTTDLQKDFMLRTMLDYMQTVELLVIDPRRKFNEQLTDPSQNLSSQVYSLASVCNHSCDPNTLNANAAGRLKLIALRPIRKGDQILVSYGPLYEEDPDVLKRKNSLITMHFNCQCAVCDPIALEACKLAAESVDVTDARLKEMYEIVMQWQNDKNFSSAKLDTLEHFVESYGSYGHLRDDYLHIGKLYRIMLLAIATGEGNALLRGKAAEAV